MRALPTFIVCIGFLFSTVVVAADPPYVGRWINKDKSASTSTLELAVAEGFDLVITQGAAVVKANFDGREYQPLRGSETIKIARVGSNGFSLTVSIDGKPMVVDTFTLSEDGQTLTQVGGLFGQPPNHKSVYGRSN